MLAPVAIQIFGGVQLEADVESTDRGVEIVRIRLTDGSNVLEECSAQDRHRFCDVGLLWRIRGAVHEYHPHVRVLWRQ